MTRWTQTLVLLSLCLVLDAAEADDQVAKGRALAKRLCAICHMAPNQGEKQGPNDIPGFAAVAQRRHQTVEGIVAWLRSTPPIMPNHRLTQDEMHALAVFIITLKGAPHSVPDRQRGQ